ncbi:MAG: hypothetical protein K0M78_07150, partial [Brevundimonas sp.]|nr:hypothetical protein [Brevundimonas sp.]
MSLPSSVERVGRAAAVPTYVYDLARVRARQAPVAAHPWSAKRILLATKANHHPPVQETLREAG